MRLADAITEGLRNATEGGARTLALATLVFVAWSGASAFDGVVLQQLHDLERADWAAGGSAFVVRAQDGVDGRSCSDAVAQPPVLAAGAMKRTDQSVYLQARPQSPMTIIDITPGLLKVLQETGRLTVDRRPLEVGDALVSRDSARAFGLRLGDTHIVEANADPLRVAGTFDLSLAGPRYTAGLIRFRTAGHVFDQCLLLARPGFEESLQSIALSIVRPTNPQQSPELLRPIGASDRDLVTEHRERPTRWAWLAASVAVWATWGAAEVSRRSERGLYMAVGVTRSQLTVIRVTELAFLIAIATGGAVPVSLAVQHVLGVEPGIATAATSITVAGATSAALLLGTMSTAASRRVDVLDMVKDRG